MLSDEHYYTIIDLVDLSVSQIYELVTLHRTTLPYSIGSFLGPENLINYYQILKIDESTVSKVAIRDEKVVGFISVTLNFRATSMLFRKESRNILREVLKPTFMLHNLLSLIDIFLIKVKLFRIDPKSSYILLFFVSPSMRKIGVGGSLLKEAISVHERTKKNSIFVDTRKTSQSAIRLYARNNFLEIYKTPKSLILRRLPN